MSDDKEGEAIAGCAVIIAAFVVIGIVVKAVQAIFVAIVAVLKFLALSTIILGTAWFAGWTLWLLISWIIEHRKEAKKKLSQQYAAWLQSSPVDGEHAQAQQSAKGLEQQLKELRKLIVDLQGRNTAAMLPTHRSQHEETLVAVREAIKDIQTHERVWRERLIVLTAQRMLQCALRSVPPWLGGAPFEDYPHGSEHLRPKKPDSIPAALAETRDALQKVDATLVSMRKVEEQMAAELAGASREAKMHLQTLLERAQRLHSRLSTRLIECQTHEDRLRAFALIARTPAGTLQAGELDAFFPKDIEPIDTDLLMSVPQSYDLDDKLRELKRTVAHNVAAGAADHEIEATTQAPGGHVLPPRKPRTTH